MVIGNENLRRIENKRIGCGVHAIEMRRPIGAVSNIKLAVKLGSESIVSRAILDAAGLIFVVEGV